MAVIVAKLTVCYDREVVIERRKKITHLSEQILAFDSTTLTDIQLLFPDDLKVYNLVNEISDALFRLDSQMRGCDVAEFCNRGMDVLANVLLERVKLGVIHRTDHNIDSLKHRLFCLSMWIDRRFQS
jgi:hypothetical protein